MKTRISLWHVPLITLLMFNLSTVLRAAETEAVVEPILIGSRLELMIDDFLVAELKGTRFRLHEPAMMGEVMRFDAPWEGSFTGYFTVLQDGKLLRMYYRGIPTSGGDETSKEVTCYAESSDGIKWIKPSLGLYEVQGTRSNNIVLAYDPPFSANFAPFIDQRPGVPADERFKAVAGGSRSGLFAFVSGDGIKWRKLLPRPILTEGQFDSQNIVFWSESEKCYACYYRTWTKGPFAGFRTISRSTSTNFVDWSPGVEMSLGDNPREHLYTSQTQPYFRASHIYIATPMRFVPSRKVLTDERAQALGVRKGYAGDCADTVLMSSRGGTQYNRTFMEGFIRPGLDPGNWASRAGLTACGIIPTGPAEISIYKQAHYAQPSAHLLRYTLRTDGFVSIHAPYKGGEMVMKPVIFSGKQLEINFSTSAAGSIQIELQDLEGKPLPDFGLADCPDIVGDDIQRVVRWKGGFDVSALAGQPVRLRFVMKDADLYALQFRP